MKKIKEFFTRWLLLNKRLLKKPVFVAILLLVPLLVSALAITGRNQQSGVLTVALACVDNADPLATEITNDLVNTPSLIRFVSCATPTEASEMVQSGRADAAWIFPSNMQEKVNRFAAYTSARNAFITVIQRENSVLLQLSHEKLGAALFAHCSQGLYLDFVRDNFIITEEMTDQQLLAYYDAIEADGEHLFNFTYPAGDSDTAQTQSQNYLLSPMRGLLAILILLSGLAVSLYYAQDRSDGKFDWLPSKRRALFAMGYHMTAVINIAVAALITLFITGLNVSLSRELCAMLLYVIITMGFCLVVRLLLWDIRVIGASLPVIVIASVALCPVFFRIVSIPAVQNLLPTYHYLTAIYDANALLRMLIYAVIVYPLAYLLYRLREK